MTLQQAANKGPSFLEKFVLDALTPFAVEQWPDRFAHLSLDEHFLTDLLFLATDECLYHYPTAFSTTTSMLDYCTSAVNGWVWDLKTKAELEDEKQREKGIEACIEKFSRRLQQDPLPGADQIPREKKRSFIENACNVIRLKYNQQQGDYFNNKTLFRAVRHFLQQRFDDYLAVQALQNSRESLAWAKRYQRLKTKGEIFIFGWLDKQQHKSVQQYNEDALTQALDALEENLLANKFHYESNLDKYFESILRYKLYDSYHLRKRDKPPVEDSGDSWADNTILSPAMLSTIRSIKARIEEKTAQLSGDCKRLIEAVIDGQHISTAFPTKSPATHSRMQKKCFEYLRDEELFSEPPKNSNAFIDLLRYLFNHY